MTDPAQGSGHSLGSFILKGASRGAEGPEEKHGVSRDMAELLNEQDRTLQMEIGQLRVGVCRILED